MELPKHTEDSTLHMASTWYDPALYGPLTYQGQAGKKCPHVVVQRRNLRLVRVRERDMVFEYRDVDTLGKAAWRPIRVENLGPHLPEIGRMMVALCEARAKQDAVIRAASRVAARDREVAQRAVDELMKQTARADGAVTAMAIAQKEAAEPAQLDRSLEALHALQDAHGLTRVPEYYGKYANIDHDIACDTCGAWMCDDEGAACCMSDCPGTGVEWDVGSRRQQAKKKRVGDVVVP
jgi:hypothetical protein